MKAGIHKDLLKLMQAVKQDSQRSAQSQKASNKPMHPPHRLSKPIGKPHQPSLAWA